MRRLLVSALLIALALAAGHGTACAAALLARSVIGAGGAPSTGTIRSNGTLAQPIIGLSQGGAIIARHGFWQGGLLYPSSAPDDPALLAGPPGAFGFGSPFPNPSSGPVAFSLTLPAAASVRLELIDVSGRLAAAPFDDHLAAGSCSLVWDGRGIRGSTIPSGIYYARLEVGGRVAARRTVVVVR